MTTTSLPSAVMKLPFLLVVEQRLGVVVQKLHREMDAFERASFDRQIARLGRARAEDDGVEFREQVLRGIIVSRPRCW